MKFFSLDRNSAYAFITLMCLVFIGACYFFIYMPHNEKDVQEQRFRTLQNIAVNVHEKIKNSKSLLNQILTHPDVEQRDKYIKVQNAPGFFTIAAHDIKSESVTDSTDSIYNIVLNNAKQQLAISVNYKYNPPKSNRSIAFSLSMQYDFNKFIKNLLPANVFDQYIVFSAGFPFYESFSSGISDAMQDSLLNNRNGVGGSSVRDITLGGTAYKLFLQPVNLDKNNSIIIGGLLSSSRYQQEKAQLPSGAIMFLVTLLLSMIVTFPWIKLYQTGNKDRLTLMDGVASVVASMLLMSLLFFCFFKYNVPLRPKLNPDGTNSLSKRITVAFTSEIDSSYSLLYNLDTLKTSEHLKGDINNLDKQTIRYNDSNARTDSNLFKKLDSLTSNASINRVFWLDSAGNEIMNWTTEKENPTHGNFKERDYFTNIINNKSYYLNNDTSKKYFLDQVISRTNGVFTSVISIPASSFGKDNTSKIAAMAFDFKSLGNTVLPTGYQYSIIDGSGNVLYNSDASRNLQENMLNEFSEKNKLSSHLQAHTAGFFTTQYFSKNYFASIAPFNGLPYYLVLLEDAGYKETRDIEVYSFTYSMLILFFSFLILQLVITFLVSSKRSFFKKQLFDTSWIGPKISFNGEYLRCAAANIFVLVLLCLFFNRTTFLQYLFMLLFSVSFIVLFLNTLFARRYNRQHKHNNFKLKLFAIYWLCTLIIIINIAAFNVLDTSNISKFILFQLLAFAGGALLFFFERILKVFGKKIHNKLPAKWRYVHSFSLLVITRLMITSGLPVAFFYITAYNFEQNISIRYKLLTYSDKLIQQFPDLPKSLGDTSGSGLSRTGIYYDGGWIKENPKINKAPATRYASWPTSEEKITLSLLSLFRLPLTDKAVLTDELYNTQPDDTSIIFNKMPVNPQECAGVSLTRRLSNNNTFLSLKSYGLNYHVPAITGDTSLLAGLLFWSLLLVMLIIFFFVIYNIIKKMFALNLPDLKVWKDLDDKIIVDAKLNKLLFIIGLPGSGKLEYLKTKINNKEIFFDTAGDLILSKPHSHLGNVFVADLINIPDSSENKEANAEWIALQQKVFDKKNRLIIVNHFEYNIQDEATNRIKLNFLEKLMLENKCKIIILSTIHPVAFLDSVNDYAVTAEKKSDPGHDLERWHVLLGHYRIAIIPLPDMEPQAANESWKQLICRETRYTHFLHSMQDITLEISGSPDAHKEKAFAQKTDELAFKLQVTAHYFYMYIWQSLTKEEKYLLYDLAEDNLVNSYDDYNLSLLIGKGLLIHDDGTLVFFNKGFRNFILTAIGNTEAMKIQQRIKDNGNWSKLRVPLLIIIFSILAFLLISQQEAYSKLVTYIAALSAGVPAVLKLFSLFDKNTQKSS